jgi:uncharacterized integral membrane protein (TIGR00698 family)
MTTNASLSQRSLSSPHLWAQGARRLALGIGISAAIAIAAMALGEVDWFQRHGLSPLTLAIVLGMLMGNTAYPRVSARAAPGVAFSKQTLLRAGVVLYGLRLTTQDVAHVGAAGVLVDTVVLGSTFLLACHVGTRWLRLDRATAMLIGAGSAICGAAAVMATASVVRARAEQVTVAISTVVLFGTVAIFLYPALFELNRHWAIVRGGAAGFGIYVGSTVHEVAQVAAAGRSIGLEAMDTAVIAKMVRVMLLAPFLIALSTWLTRNRCRGAPASGDVLQATDTRVVIPWFAFGFVGLVLFNSLNLLPVRAVSMSIQLDTFLLAMAMSALGLSTNLADIRRAGTRPLLLALFLFAWLIAGGALINRAVMAL